MLDEKREKGDGERCDRNRKQGYGKKDIFKQRKGILVTGVK